MSIALEVFEIASRDKSAHRAIVVEDDESGLFSIDGRVIDPALYATSHSAFTALQEFRRLLRSRGLDVRCYGAMPNVYPSPMMRSGTRAYRLEMGKPATMNMVVDIFDYVDVHSDSSVDQQDGFYKEWLASLD